MSKSANPAIYFETDYKKVKNIILRLAYAFIDLLGDAYAQGKNRTSVIGSSLQI